MTKDELRAHTARARDALTAPCRAAHNARIFAHLTQSSAWRDAARVFTFVSIRTEVDTHALIQCAWAQGKRVYIPRTYASHTLAFYEYTPDTPLLTTRYGTLEPHAPEQIAAVPRAGDLFLAPGLVFDGAGNRYGYGGGFYDRYLAQHPVIRPIALAFGLQLHSARLAVDAHDIPMAQIITEDGIHTCT